MTTNSRIDTVIFDFDGTIMDTNGVIMRSWQHTYRTLTGHDGDVDHILSTFGEPLEFSLENAFPEVPVKESLKIYRDWHREHFQSMIRLFPGVESMLAEIKARGLKTGIATSRVMHTLREGLEKYDIGRYFDAIVTVEDIERPKPEPDTILKVLEKLHSGPETSIMIGDSLPDILCARNAGTASVLVGWSATLAGKTKEDFAPDEAPDHIIYKAEDILDII